MKKLRKIKGITSKELAEIIGVTQQGVISYENNNAYPSRNILLKLKDFWGNDILCDEYSRFITDNYNTQLKTWRKNNGLTYKDAAVYLGMAQATYYDLENIVYIITPKNFKRYKDKLLKILKKEQ